MTTSWLLGTRSCPAARGDDGHLLARERGPALIFLELMLPDILGTEVCRAIEDDVSMRATPVLRLAAKGEKIGMAHDAARQFRGECDSELSHCRHTLGLTEKR